MDKTDRLEQLDQDIDALERDIAARRASLPYAERGYFEEERKIKQLESKLLAMKVQRDHADG